VEKDVLGMSSPVLEKSERYNIASLVGNNVNQSVLLVELDLSGGKGEEGEIPSQSDVASGMILGSALAKNDVPGQHSLATEFLDPKPLTVAVPAVFGSTLSFFMCHGRISFELLQVNGLDFDN
jgi:hypothetical protein